MTLRGVEMNHIRAASKRLPGRAADLACWENCRRFKMMFLAEHAAEDQCCDKCPGVCA